MIIWTGWGILAGLIWAAVLLLTPLVVDSACGPGYYTAHAAPKILASAITAPIVWAVGRSMNGSPTSGVRKSGRARHTLFFVPMEYWGPLFLAIGIVIALIPAAK
jgi:hypothetical protein